MSSLCAWLGDSRLRYTEQVLRWTLFLVCLCLCLDAGFRALFSCTKDKLSRPVGHGIPVSPDQFLLILWSRCRFLCDRVCVDVDVLTQQPSLLHSCYHAAEVECRDLHDAHVATPHLVIAQRISEIQGHRVPDTSTWHERTTKVMTTVPTAIPLWSHTCRCSLMPAATTWQKIINLSMATYVIVSG